MPMRNIRLMRLNQVLIGVRGCGGCGAVSNSSSCVGKLLWSSLPASINSSSPCLLLIVMIFLFEFCFCREFPVQIQRCDLGSFLFANKIFFTKVFFINFGLDNIH